jgi:hypothetical protein
MPNTLALLDKHKKNGKVHRVRARTRIWKAAFLKALRIAPSVKHACKVAKIDRRTAYKHRDKDEEFAVLWDDAIAASIDELEAVAFRKAAEGDSNLLTFLLRCHKPQIYRDVIRNEVAVAGVVFLPEKKPGSP